MMLDYRGQVAEATGANFSFVKDGVIHTPPELPLSSIARQIEFTKHHGIELVERAIFPEELRSLSECFPTGLAAEVTLYPKSAVSPHVGDDLGDADERLHGGNLSGRCNRRRIRPQPIMPLRPGAYVHRAVSLSSVQRARTFSVPWP